MHSQVITLITVMRRHDGPMVNAIDPLGIIVIVLYSHSASPKADIL